MVGRSAVANPSGALLYKEVKRKIIDAVHQGEWKPGGAIPSETKLCERYGVSMGTVRKAVDELSGEGFLIRQQGRGTFISTHSQDRYLFAFFHVIRQDGHKEYPLVELVEFGKAKAEPCMATALDIKPKSRVLRIVNKLSLSGAPVMLDEILLPENLFLGMTEKMLRERPSTLYHLYQEQFGVTVIRPHEKLRAVLADEVQARLLGVSIGEPLLLIIRTAYSFRDQPVELRRSYVVTRNYEYCTDPMVAT
ncbi:MAG: GntR family transcriptional regulator [Rhodocyclaceae bacterium]|jgi:GntR family transcriptional regulator|nr:GntR family transcriptional regulator [Rhodocyclaceae bacterium]